jgi:hypothetical protein
MKSVEVIENEGARSQPRQCTEKLGVRNRIGPSIAGQSVERINKEAEGRFLTTNGRRASLNTDRQSEYL